MRVRERECVCVRACVRVRACVCARVLADWCADRAGKNLLLDPMSDITALAGRKGTGGKKKALSPAQKAAIAAKMKALRQKILGDFSSMTKFGKRVDCR